MNILVPVIGQRVLPIALFATVFVCGNVAADTVTEVVVTSSTSTLYDPTGTVVESLPLVGYGNSVGRYWNLDGTDVEAQQRAYLASTGQELDCTKTNNQRPWYGWSGTTTDGGDFSYTPNADQSGSLAAVTANGSDGVRGGSVLVANKGSGIADDYSVEDGNQCEDGSVAGPYGAYGGQPGGHGGSGGDASLTVKAGSRTYQVGNTAIIVQSLGGDGGEGGDSYKNKDEPWGETGDGGYGGRGGKAQVTNYADLDVHGTTELYVEKTVSEVLEYTWVNGMLAYVVPGTETDLRGIVTNTAHGIVVQSGGGIGADGGENPTNNGAGSSGGIAGNGSEARVENYGDITTNGGSAIIAQSIGGMGGDAGLNKKGQGGAGGNGGDGGYQYNTYAVRVINDGTLTVNQTELPECSVAQNVTNNCLVTEQNASDISHFGNYCDERVDTCDAFGAYGIYAQSVGGGGGNSGAASGSHALGADGGAAGYGYLVGVNNSGAIALHGQGSKGIFAQSIGGGGGSGGMAHAKGSDAIAIGGSGGDGGYGGVVQVNNSGNVCTGSACDVALEDLKANENAVGGAAGIFAQSVGGGGGDGGSAKAKSTGHFFGLVGGKSLAIGGSGGNGGDGLGVTVANTGSIVTAEINSPGIFAQSIGGGGGNGAGAVAFDVSLLGHGKATAIGGSGGGGGDGKRVSVNCASYSGAAIGATACGDASWTLTTPSQTLSQKYKPYWLSSNDDNQHVIATAGLASAAIFAQAVGGGGGSGGYAVAVAGSAVDVMPTVAFAQGGSGGGGGDGGAVYAGSNGMQLYTLGDDSSGIVAQSVGGGGGSGGYAVSLAASVVGTPLSMAVGGDGEAAGNGYHVTADNPGGLITTAGDYSHGIMAQSIGGGGGSGGMSASASGTLLGISSAVALGGSGDSGGNGSTVKAYNRNGAALGMSDVGSASIFTQGYGANAILAQSIGGGGGAGGASMAGSAVLANFGAASLSIGGNGSKGGTGAAVTVENWGNLTTLGDEAVGISAQSLGGGGGTGGNAVSVSGSVTGVNLSVALGGSGGDGSQSDRVTVSNNGGDIATTGAFSHGIMAQSLGGGGGSGGMAVSGSASLVGITASAAVGGNGAAGGTAGAVVVSNKSGTALGNSGAGSANILTRGDGANAILAQSVGGGGGAGGISAAASAALGGANVSLSIGGGGGTGSTGNTVTVTSSGQLVTRGKAAAALVAQSIGGSGGMGGFSASASGDLLGEPVALSLGGKGGNGGKAGAVSVDNSGVIGTQGDIREDVASQGILAQSIGGNGGAGGLSLAATGTISGRAEVSMSLGGAGSGGGTAGTVTVGNTGQTISTQGAYAQGILAQSIGGNGGAGGMALSAAASVTSRAAAVSIGGSGNSGGQSAAVTVTSNGDIVTNGYGASALAAQSIAGFGGSGGASATSTFTFTNAGAVAVGGGAGSGAKSGNVQVQNSGNLTTLGGGAAALLAQSIGGDGGIGGLAASASVTFGSNGSLTLGGDGAAGGTAGSAQVDNQGDILVVAEDTGSVDIPAVPNDSVNQALEAWALVSGDEVEMPDEVAELYNLITGQANPRLAATQANAPGILVQSLGGGGGAGGLAAAAGVVASGVSFDTAVGGDGGGGGKASQALVDNSGSIVTQGAQSPGIAAMSMGGQGGVGGFAASVGASGWDLGAVATSVGGDGGKGGIAGTVTLTTANGSLARPIMTQGSQSPALLAMSIGGNGGVGGFDAAATLSTLGSASVGVGGDGGDGGKAGDVKVDSSQYLTTSGLMSPGVLAMSIGGHGGMGGISASVAESLVKSLAASVGGNGGAGGKSGRADVTVDAPVVTYGNLSAGVVAQAIAGSGGMGGAAVSSVVTLDVVPNKPYELNVGGAAGGSGGSGGQAGTAHVTSNSLIQTYGFLSNAVVAQSIGGSGGMGGLAVDGSFDLDANVIPGLEKDDDYNVSLALAVGGEGGVGGNGGTAHVDQSGTLVSGYGLVESGKPGGAFLSSGILAQSIGGSGGMGGSAMALAAGTSSSRAALSVGGMGGVGGNAGQVTVYSNRDCEVNQGCSNGITTFGAGSAAIKAQSIGGGGGSGGSVISAASVGSMPTAVGVGGAGGGSGGKAGNASTVNVEVGGSLTTVGFNSPGVLAQSVGGGGGDGGASVTGIYKAGTVLKKALALFGVKLGDDDSSDSDDEGFVHSAATTVADVYGSVTGTDLPASLAGSGSVSVGGNGGAGGNGAAVTVTSTARIITGAAGKGYQSAGILAQSVGGGGGNGGFASVDQVGSVTGSILLGGNGGIAGNGGTTSITASNLIMTRGAASSAVVAQSIGGGGGTGGQTFDRTQALGAFSLGLGADGGDGGNAAKVSVSSSATLVTNGLHSSGIVAQSIGGGGGNASGSLIGKVGNLLPETVGAASTARIGSFSMDDLLESGAQVGTADGSHAGQAGADAGVAFSMMQGGTGGIWGNGGGVQVNNSGNIFTGAEQDENGNIVASGTLLRTAGSAAILAQSIGGGGGVSNASSIDANFGKSSMVAVEGGSKDSNGYGGTATVLNTGSLFTYGANSAGIIAQSIGGGGGVSGTVSAISSTLAGMAGSAANAFRLGANVTNSYASMVKVCDASDDNGACKTSDKDQVIVTGGTASHGIVAQSVGGSGGYVVALDSAVQEAVSDSVVAADADLSVDGWVLESSITNGVAVATSLGGKGGSNSKSGNRSGERVRVVTAADIQTQGTGAIGVLAQSVGGGGGLGLSHSRNAGSGDHRFLAVLGADMYGPDATSGNGYVVLDGIVATMGDLAHGVVAQTVAGGGGLSQSSSHTVAVGGVDDVDITLGAQGGIDYYINNSSDTLWVSLNNAVQTSGAGAVGVLAQSVGAGGGMAASQTSSLSNGDVDVALKLGSEGVNGAGNTVTLNYGKGVTTAGDNALGLIAQSIGGGGGLALVDHDSAVASGDVSLTFELGFREPTHAGSFSGAVTVTNAVGTVVTQGDNAAGLLIQSVAGGGTALFAGSQAAEDSEVNVGFQLGGTGNQTSGNAVTATLGTSGNRDSLISTQGNNAMGLVAQSIGGGGGLAAFSLSPPGDSEKVTDGQLTDGALGMTERAVSSGNQGGAVSLDLYDYSIETSGMNSAGLVAQSIGGGGGIAAAAINGGGFDEPLSLFDGTLQLGASDGGSGATGGNVNANLHGTVNYNTANSPGIITFDAMSPAVLAQSIGGGGGLAAVLATNLVLGGNTGSAGGDVTVDNQVYLEVDGHGSVGLLAQSIGGGGGLAYGDPHDGNIRAHLGGTATNQAAGNVTVSDHSTYIVTNRTGMVGLVAQSIGGGGGLVVDADHITLGGAASGANGGDVHVDASGYIATSGDFGHGILAQSVGGGGGAVLASRLADNEVASIEALAGSGDSGDVRVDVNGVIATSGDYAHGVVAQSAAGGGGLVQDGIELKPVYGGGSGKPGQVLVNVYQQIYTMGKGSNAIYVTNSDDPKVMVARGATVTGGEGGSAVYFDAGSNELRNSGVLSTQDGAEGLVVNGVAGDTRLYNEAGGILLGAVRLHQDGANLLHNALGGTVLAGADMDLGDGGLLRNAGELGLASEVIGATTVVGDLIQEEGGTLALRFDQRDGTADHVQVTGDAQLEGVIAPRLVNAGYIRPGTRQARVFTAGGELDIGGLAALDRGLLSHALSVGDEGLVVTTTADFAPAGLDADGRRLGGVLGSLQSAGGTRLSRSITEMLAQLPDVQALNDAYETVGSGGVAAVPMMSLQNASLLMDTVTSRLDGWRTDELAGRSRVQSLTPGSQDERAVGAWLSVSGNTRRGHDLTSDVHAMMVGVDRTLGERTLIGGALTGSRLSFDLDQPDVRASGDEYGLNVYGLRRFGNAYGSVILFAASNRVDYRSHLHGWRSTLSGETEFDNLVFGSRVEGGYDLDLLARRLTLTPFLAVQPMRVEQDDAREVYNDDLGPGVDFRATTIESLPMDLGVQVGTHWTLGSGARLKSFARLAWRHDFETERAVQRDFSTVRLRDSSLPVARDSTHARIGVSYGVGRRFSLTGGMEGQWSREYDALGGSLGVMYRW